MLFCAQAPTRACVVRSNTSMVHGVPVTLVAVDAESRTRSPAASTVLSADRSIHAVDCDWSTGWALVAVGGAGARDELAASDTADEESAGLSLHAPGAPKLGFAWSEGHDASPAGNEATPSSGMDTAPKEQLAPGPELGHW